MSEDILQIEYDSMEEIAGVFIDQAGVIESMIQNLRFYIMNLEGHWYGTAADKFFNEMEGEVFPALNRLSAALTAGGDLTIKIIETLSDAEEAAADQFAFGEPSSPSGTIPAHPDGDYGVSPIPGVTPSSPHPDVVDGLVLPPSPIDIPAHPDIDYAGGVYPPAAGADNANVPADIGRIPEPVEVAGGKTVQIEPEMPTESVEAAGPEKLFEDDDIAEVVLIELVRPPITNIDGEVVISIAAEGGIGVVTGETGVEVVRKYENPIDIGSGEPDNIEVQSVTEVTVGADLPIAGNGNTPDLSIGAGVYFEAPIGPQEVEGKGGVQVKAELGPVSGAAKAGANGIGTFEVGIMLPPGMVPSGPSEGGITGYVDPSFVPATVNIVYERSYDNVIQAAVPLEVYNQYNGDLKEIHNRILAPSFNDEDSSYQPTGRLTHIDTIQVDHVNKTITVRTINDVLAELDRRQQIGIATYGNPQTLMPENAGQGKIVIPINRDNTSQIPDYSGAQYDPLNLGGEVCYPKQAGSADSATGTYTIKYHDGSEYHIPAELIHE